MCIKKIYQNWSIDHNIRLAPFPPLSRVRDRSADSFPERRLAIEATKTWMSNLKDVHCIKTKAACLGPPISIIVIVGSYLRAMPLAMMP